MSQPEQPQIYLLTPAEFDLSQFSDRLSAVLDAQAVACVRLALASRDEDRICRAGDALREICHARDVALVIDNHTMLAERLGLDGVHLADGSRSVRKARKQLGPDAIVGAFCGASRHDGITAGEAGADYVSFGPVSETGLDSGELAGFEVFEWWSEMIEVPVVAEGGLTREKITTLAPVTDFFAIGDEIWQAPDAVASLSDLMAALGNA